MEILNTKNDMENKEFKLNNLKMGVATASLQIEGGNKNNQWYEWSMKPGKIADGTNTLRAINHYNKVEEDTLLMKSLNVEIYRMSIEWARIEPEENIFDINEMKHYRDEIEFIQKQGIEVLVTLHHFTNPIWFENKGAFLSEDAVENFSSYTNYVVSNLADLNLEYCTINEPNIYATQSYYFGIWPPEQKSFWTAMKVMKKMAKCHVAAYKIIKSINKDTRVGFADSLCNFEPRNPKNIFDRLSSKLHNRIFNYAPARAFVFDQRIWPLGFFGKKNGEYIDFMGINYYTRSRCHGLKNKATDGAPTNDLGWEICPEGITKVCEQSFKLFGKEIYITENGTPDHADSFRAQFIYDHLFEISKLPYVKRYYHWSFMDNFEWALGETPRFGLVEVDYDTEERIVRKSGKFYSEIIKNKEITKDMISNYLKK